ncbi:MAG TPA: hypothetical protein VGT98_02395 [Candidatus Elarobacter sp.]|nr:hypothetical protein [Candidatus Elarobacter sp.]
MSKLFAALALAMLAPVSASLSAQQVVGHPPETSPYEDVRSSQHLTLFGGYFRPQQDRLGAAPQGGPTVGLRYEIPVAGPADFFVRAQRVSSHRTAYDPTLPPATRNLGDHGLGLYLADLGFAFDLTGRKSWHHVIPVIDFGLGIASASGQSTAKDPYTFGSQFAINLDAGLRIVPSSSYELRFMAGSSFYQNHYPAAYFVTPTVGVPPILEISTPKSGFRNAMTYSAGLAIPLFR